MFGEPPRDGASAAASAAEQEPQSQQGPLGSSVMNAKYGQFDANGTVIVAKPPRGDVTLKLSWIAPSDLPALERRAGRT